MTITETQLPDIYRQIIDEQLATFSQRRSISDWNSIPDTSQIPLDNQSHWLKIPDVISVFVDMKGSTKLSATTADRDTAGAYQLFTGTAVRLFHEFEASYIDVRGDGVFGLFNRDEPHRALAAAVSFKTFSSLEFAGRVKKLTGVDVGCHVGIDQKTVLVRKIGLRSVGGRTDRQNEVWAGKPINMSAKLASLSADDEVLASERYFRRLTHPCATMSCGCPDGQRKALWTEKTLINDDRFDFTAAYSLKSKWCATHGAAFCATLMEADTVPRGKCVGE
ncbi:MAG: adenylate/guanylate cyclase domain-containing protein [Deltaproteobacteria bacterium]|nr:adenylate/guanylate cyclase domain-containing protein [Deltaproteobacteria bacterium]